MQPSRILIVEALPKLASGKADVKEGKRLAETLL
jgi:hypothetical protein